MIEEFTPYKQFPVRGDVLQFDIMHHKPSGAIAIVHAEIPLELLAMVSFDKAEFIGKELYPFIETILQKEDVG